MNHADRRELIFMDDADRQRFVDTLGEVCAKTGWQVHAYVLMPNHFHWVVETPQPNLVAGMKWLLGTYTSRFNRRHKLFGHLFSGRYKSLIVDGSGSGYLKSVGDYVHLNPARAKLVAADAPLKSFAWSSWPAYLLARSKRPAWLRADRLLGWWGIPKDCLTGRQRLEWALEERRGAEEGEEFKPIRRGWCLGEETFREELLTQMSERMGGGALRRGARRDGGGAGGTDHRGGVEAGAVAGSGSQHSAQGGFSEGGFGCALAGGNDDDGGVDRRASGDGHARLSQPSLVSPEEAGECLGGHCV